MNPQNEVPPISSPLSWHAPAWRQVGEQLNAGRLPHALLLAGPSGVGKSEFALAVARLLLCHRPSAGLNCGECPACVQSAGNSHGDFRWLSPEDKSKVIKIDQVRAAIDFVSRTASYGTRKVLVLQPADAMTLSAANALLKCLEEPAGETTIILVCERLHALPATVRSRCQLLKFDLPERAASLAWLDTVSGERELSETLLSLTEGRPLPARALFESGDIEDYAGRRAVLDAVVSGSATIAQARGALGGIDLEDLLQLLLAHIHRRLRAMSAHQLRGEAARGLYGLQDELLRSRGALAAGSNPNREMMLDSLLAELAAVG